MPEVIIQTEALTKIYGLGDVQVLALDRVDLRISENEFVAVMGPSGSGKSTLMNILGCLDRPTEGRYLLAGQEVGSLSKPELARIRNQNLGFIFQSYNLLPNTTALENVMLPMLYNRHNGHLSAAEQKDKALALLELVNLSDRVNHHPKELSGGQMQRVAIARALVNDPVLILADEPTGNLDTHASDEIAALLRQVADDWGRSVVMVTHDPRIAAYADRIVFLKDGVIVDETPLNGKHIMPAAVTGEKVAMK